MHPNSYCLPNTGEVIPGISSNVPIFPSSSCPSSSATIVTNHCTSNVQPQLHQQKQLPLGNNSSTPGLTVPSQSYTNTTTSTISQNNMMAPTQNAIYLSIASGDETTRHRFCLVVQMMCSLLQKNGQSANAINHFTEKFKYLKEQADLSPQNEHKLLEALFNFGNTNLLHYFFHFLCHCAGF